MMLNMLGTMTMIEETVTTTCPEESTDYLVSLLQTFSPGTELNLFSVVSDLLMNEARSEEKFKQKSLTKSEDSGHDSGQSSLNTGSAGSESFSESSG